MYNVYPYLYRDSRVMPKLSEDDVGSAREYKRGDLEGYVVAENFASQNYSDCTKALALANINSLKILRADMTPREYINILIKQGQVPDKHFKYRQLESAYEITELNSSKDPVKQVLFYSPNGNGDVSVECKYFTPDSGRCFKLVQYKKDGTVNTITDFENIYDEQSAANELEKIEQVRQAQKIANQTVPIQKGKKPFEKMRSV